MTILVLHYVLDSSFLVPKSFGRIIFAETFNYSKDSLYKPSKTKTDKALEWAQLVTDDKNKILGSPGLSPSPTHTGTSVSQGQDSIFIPLQFVDNILPQLSIFGLI